MPSITEDLHRGAFVVSEANGHRSRLTDVLASDAGNNLQAGAVLGRQTVDGKLYLLAPAAADGTETAVAVLYGAVDASAADQPCVTIGRDAEVNDNDLNYAGADAGQKTQAIADLAAVGIIVRS